MKSQLNKRLILKRLLIFGAVMIGIMAIILTVLIAIVYQEDLSKLEEPYRNH